MKIIKRRDIQTFIASISSALLLPPLRAAKK
jgi:hypothetical protein